MPAEMARPFFAIQGSSLVGPEAAERVLRLPRELTTGPVERVVVVMKDGAAREAPLAAVLLDQTRTRSGRAEVYDGVSRTTASPAGLPSIASMELTRFGGHLFP